MKAALTALAIIALVAVRPALSGSDGDAERLALIRDLTAEFGTASLVIPRSKKPLEITPAGTYDADQWTEAMTQYGPAARLGDLVQVTKVEIKKDSIEFEINHGIKGGRKWWHKVQVSGSTRGSSTLGQGQSVYAPGGTILALVFENGLPDDKTAADYKEMLKPVLNFDQRSATEAVLDSLSDEFRKAVEDHEVLVGMDKDIVLMSKDRPDKKYRETVDGVQREDWIYGTPPGRVIFVTFEDDKVVEVKDTYANLGGTVATPEPPDGAR